MDSRFERDEKLSPLELLGFVPLYTPGYWCSVCSTSWTVDGDCNDKDDWTQILCSEIIEPSRRVQVEVDLGQAELPHQATRWRYRVSHALHVSAHFNLAPFPFLSRLIISHVQQTSPCPRDPPRRSPGALRHPGGGVKGTHHYQQGGPPAASTNITLTAGLLRHRAWRQAARPGRHGSVRKVSSRNRSDR